MQALQLVLAMVAICLPAHGFSGGTAVGVQKAVVTLRRITAVYAPAVEPAEVSAAVSVEPIISITQLG